LLKEARKMKISVISLVAMLLISNAIVLFVTPIVTADQPQWPTSWILYDTDPTENGASDDYRDVKNAYCNKDDNYLYFRLECYDVPSFTDDHKVRYKIFLDIDDPHNMIRSGGTVYDAEYIIFVEDTSPPEGDGIGDVYLLNDVNNNGTIRDDWPNYLITPGPVLDNNIAGYRIDANCIDLYVSQINISNPLYSYFTWSTDHDDPNFDSSPQIDRSNSYWDEDLSKADISIEKSDSIDPVSSGGFFSYSLNVINHGPNVAINVNVTDVLPEEVSFVSSNFAYEFIDSTYWWNFPSLSVGESKVITISVEVDNGYTGVIYNFASVYSDTREPSPFDNEDTEQTTVVHMADLSISKSTNLGTVYPGQTLIYTLNVTNNGPEAASNVVVYDTLPAEVTFSSANPTQSGKSGPVYWWNIGSLAVGQYKLITINVVINNVPKGTIITNNANVTSSTYDPTSSNNNVVKQITVGSSADLSISKTADTNFVYVGDYITYTINLINNGPDSASNVFVYDDLPSEVTFNYAVPTPNGNTDSLYWWHYSSLAAGESKQIKINVTVDSVPAGTINNIVNVTSDTYDPTPGNSGDSEQITMGKSADLSLTKTAYPNVVSPGGNLKYTIVVTNNGPDAAENVSVSDTLPNKVTYNSSYPTPIGISGSTYWWNYSSLGAGQSKTIIINVTVNKNATGKIINTANVTSDTHDPNPGDESNEDDEETDIYVPPSGGGGGGGGGAGGVTNQLPIADANGPYFGFIGEEIEFDGTASHDNDEDGETIVQYDWKFFDEDTWHLDLGATPKYIYYASGVYNVSLSVLDDEGSSSVNTTTVTITQANLPPTNVIIIGEVNGHQNISYTYDINATDPDGDNITYTVNWGDGNSDISDSIASEEIYTVNHIWTAPGQYIVTVSAEDELGAQTDEAITVLIDILFVKDIGYLIDYDSDGTYNKFYSNKTGKETITEKLDDGRYLINDDDDDKWEWIYDPDTDTLENYIYGEETDLTLWYLIIILILIVLITLLLLLYRKKKKKETPS
jgi:uncharacterized repeat protein (TIGR01451 family)